MRKLKQFFVMFLTVCVMTGVTTVLPHSAFAAGEDEAVSSELIIGDYTSDLGFPKAGRTNLEKDSQPPEKRLSDKTLKFSWNTDKQYDGYLIGSNSKAVYEDVNDYNYINLWVYFEKDSARTGTQYIDWIIKTGIFLDSSTNTTKDSYFRYRLDLSNWSEGWNLISVKKSDFTVSNSADWSNGIWNINFSANGWSSKWSQGGELYLERLWMSEESAAEPDRLIIGDYISGQGFPKAGTMALQKDVQPPEKRLADNALKFYWSANASTTSYLIGNNSKAVYDDVSGYGYINMWVYCDADNESTSKLLDLIVKTGVNEEKKDKAFRYRLDLSKWNDGWNLISLDMQNPTETIRSAEWSGGAWNINLAVGNYGAAKWTQSGELYLEKLWFSKNKPSETFEINADKVYTSAERVSPKTHDFTFTVTNSNGLYDGAYVKKYISVTRNNSAVPSGEYMVKTEKQADGTTKVTVSMENNLELGGEYKIVISKDLYDRDGIVSGTDALIEFTVGKLTYTFDRTKNEATVTSDMSDEYSVLIIIKAVKDNRLVGVELLNGKVTQDAALTKTMSNVPDGAEVSAMFWDGFGSMRPLTYVQ